MRKISISALFVLISNALCAQDLIVTTNQDSINCKILMIGDGMIYYSTMKDEGIRNAIPLDQVASSCQDYYFDIEQKTMKRKKVYPAFRMAFAGGYSLRTRLPKGYWDDSYLKNMRNGFNFGIEMNYFFNESLGMGMNFYSSHFNFSKVSILHIIPTFTVRDFDKRKRSALLINVGIGYIAYSEVHRWENSESTITDKAIGLLCGVGYDIPLSNTIAVYFQASYVGDLSFLFKEYSEGFGRLNLSGGFRFSI